MKKLLNFTHYYNLRGFTRSAIVIFGMMLAIVLVMHPVKAQQKLISLELKDATLEKALEAIKEQTNIDFIFNHEVIATAPKKHISLKAATLEEALNKVLENSGFTYKRINNAIVITPDKRLVPESELEVPGLKQTLRGKVIDQDAKSPLPFATIQVMGTDPVRGTTSDLDGNFIIDNLPLGRYIIKASFVGYQDAFVSEVMLGSGKETILNIPLIESLTSLEEIVVTTNGEMLNEMAVVSGKSFDAEETKRYAASISDPARMAQVFAGVAATDDAANEIVIRGNSPNWLLWKLEGVEIPSPNHFAEEGYSSGAISILSSNMLGSSDFYTGAFSADYGNALSGVFDLKLRNGNNQQYEHTFQAGVLGFDISSEGPFSKNYRGSYLFNYRYSTLSLLNNLNIEVSENALPNYQDLSFKVNLPTKKTGTFSIWGIGGLSDVTETYLPDSTHSDYFNGYDDFTKTGMYAAGITHTYFVDDQSYFETVLSSSESYSSEDYKEIDSTRALRPFFFDQLNKQNLRLSSYYNRKFSNRLSMRYGMILSRLNYDYTSRVVDEDTNDWKTEVDNDGHTSMAQAYIMAKYKFSEKLISTIGGHYTYFALNDDMTVEPRLGLAYDLNRGQKLTFGYGMHSRHENLPVYFVQRQNTDGSTYLLNKDLQLTRAHHVVLGYSKAFTRKLQFKSEVYYQHIDKLPVPNNPNEYYSPIFGGFNSQDTLVNEGKGRNYGLELTLQKYFSDQYYFLVTSSLFDSKYQPKDGKWYNTRYNVQYVNNVVGGKEWNLGENKLLNFNAKVMWSGGKRQLPIDLEQSRLKGETVYFGNNPWSFKTKDYFRIDLGIKMHFFKKDKEHVLSLDIQNVTNRFNTWAQFYDSETDTIMDYPMAGIIPVLNYRLEF